VEFKSYFYLLLVLYLFAVTEDLRATYDQLPALKSGSRSINPRSDSAFFPQAALIGDTGDEFQDLANPKTQTTGWKPDIGKARDSLRPERP
jgi:hypothetical protein